MVIKSCLVNHMLKLSTLTSSITHCARRPVNWTSHKKFHSYGRKCPACISQGRHPFYQTTHHPSTSQQHQTLQTLQHDIPSHRFSSTSETDGKALLNHLWTRIKANGPITIADYMREVLTNPQSGYYMHKDVFGSHGDFITSPEISQIFGEMLGIWVVNEWMNHYDEQELQIVELGPGRGTLADDMLRVFSQFPAIKDKVSLHLVEVSPTLGSMQASKLSGRDASEFFKDMKTTDCEGPYFHFKSKYGHNVSWYQSINEVPNGLSCFIAHEFLDALPIHKFQKTDTGWSEILLDIDESEGSTKKLRYVLSPGETAATVAYLKPSLASSDSRDHIEVSPGSALVVQSIAIRIKEHGGFALVADYGHTGEKTDTFRAFKNHKLHDPHLEPGTADLTADVDFSYLRTLCKELVSVHGPITQEKFLTNMGIGVRLQVLLKNATTDQWSSLISGFRMLTSPDQMGERFKFMALSPKSQSEYVPAGFVELKYEQ